MNRSIKLYGGLVAIVVLAVVALIWWPRAANECLRQTNEPDLNSMTVARKLISTDRTVMSSIVGYVAILSDNTYLPLEIDTISQSVSDDSRVVSLTGRCVVLNIKYEFQDPNKYQYLGISMLVKNDTLKDKTPRNICDFESRFEFFQPASARYSCNLTQSHSCSSQMQFAQEGQSDKQVASLRLKLFELEFDRDKTGSDTWHKSPWNSSCKVWNS